MKKEDICIPVMVVCHLLMAYLLQMIARAVYLLENWSTLGDVFKDNSLTELLTGCWMFDTSAVMYTNCLVVLLIVVLPWGGSPLGKAKGTVAGQAKGTVAGKAKGTVAGQAKGTVGNGTVSRGTVSGKVVTWVFTIINSIVLVMNLGDAVYFKYTGHRTTMSVFGEFEHDNNLGSVFGIEIINHWYLVLLGVVLIGGMWWCSRKMTAPLRLPRGGEMFRYVLSSRFLSSKTIIGFSSPRGCSPSKTRESEGVKRLLNWEGAAVRLLTLLVFVPCCVAGMRGGWTTAVRPITISNANQYVEHPTEAALVLNTPFALIRTIGKSVFKDPQYFDDKTLSGIYSPVHEPLQSDTVRKVNVVVLIVESFGREYIGNYNTSPNPIPDLPQQAGPSKGGEKQSITHGPQLEGGRYKGYAPFVDSLYNESLSFDYTFANGRQSIDGMPSILSGIPRFIEPFFLTPASMNDVSGIAGELKKDGYYSAFFHGAENGSMGFEAFSRHTGYDDYFGRTEYDADKRFGGEKDFDGTWAIWDEPFLQFYAMKMSEFKEPFVSTIFTASSHHPYVVPDEYKGIYKDDNKYSVQCGGVNPIHKCIQYTDMALRKFFETARKQPWYKNTIFVFTSDHTNLYDHKEYGTDLGLFGAPLLFFDPSGRMPRGRWHCIAQQTDIMPTVLGWIGYKRPYVAWGIDLLHTPAKDTWAVNYTGGGMYQFVKGNYLLQFDGVQLKAVYNFRTDWMLTRNLLPQLRNDKTIMEYERQLKAIIQTYMQRMVNNQLTVTAQ